MAYYDPGTYAHNTFLAHLLTTLHSLSSQTSFTPMIDGQVDPLKALAQIEPPPHPAHHLDLPSTQTSTTTMRTPSFKYLPIKPSSTRKDISPLEVLCQRPRRRRTLAHGASQTISSRPPTDSSLSVSTSALTLQTSSRPIHVQSWSAGSTLSASLRRKRSRISAGTSRRNSRASIRG